MYDRADERFEMEVKSPFDYVKSINGSSKESIMIDDEDRKQYIPFVINRTLSYHQDTILFVNEMNINHIAPVDMQYDFLRLLIRPAKRFAKWEKPIPDSDDIELLMKEYSCNRTKAQEALSILTKGEIERIRDRQYCGGVEKSK